MAVLGAEMVQRLARHRGGEKPVISVYLNVDGKQNIRAEDYQAQLDAMIKEATSKDPDKPDKIGRSCLSRVQQFVNDEFERGNSRGLAIFVDADELWEVVTLPVPVENHIAINMSPYVRVLETILDQYETIGILATDKQRARLLIVELGVVVEREEVLDPLPRHDDDGGDWRKDHVKTHASVVSQHHLRHAAQAMFDLFQRRRFEHLFISVADELASELERHLHAYLRARMVGRASLPMMSSEDELIAVATEHLRKAERELESHYVSRLRAGVATNAANGRTNGDSVGAVAGLEPTLKAVFERRVDTLLVSEGYATEGWRCGSCGYIATVGRKCRMCGAEMVLVEDVVEEAVEDALGQKCRVEFCSENADLDVLGRIGALLRF